MNMICSVCGAELGRRYGDCVVDGKPYCKACYKKQFNAKEIYKLIDDKRNTIKDLFVRGYSISQICIRLGFYTFTNFECDRCEGRLVQTLRVGRKHVSSYILRKILGFKSYDEYLKELRKIRARQKQ